MLPAKGHLHAFFIHPQKECFTVGKQRRLQDILQTVRGGITEGIGSVFYLFHQILIPLEPGVEVVPAHIEKKRMVKQRRVQPDALIFAKQRKRRKAGGDGRDEPGRSFFFGDFPSCLRQNRHILRQSLRQSQKGLLGHFLQRQFLLFCRRLIYLRLRKLPEDRLKGTALPVCHKGRLDAGAGDINAVVGLKDQRILAIRQKLCALFHAGAFNGVRHQIHHNDAGRRPGGKQGNVQHIHEFRVVAAHDIIDPLDVFLHLARKNTRNGRTDIGILQIQMPARVI